MVPASARKATAHIEPYREPLFDLLVEDVPAKLGVRTDGRHLLVRSIRREIALLFNTRRSNPGLLDPATATVLDYGIPGFSFRSADAPPDLARLAQLLGNAIRIFEPRLLEPTVTMERIEGERAGALVHISGSIRLGMAVERFSFPLAVDEQTMMTAAPEYDDVQS